MLTRLKWAKQDETSRFHVVLRVSLGLLLGLLLWIAPKVSQAGESNLRTGGKLLLSKTTVADNETFDVIVPVQNSGTDETRNKPSGTPRSFYLYVYLGRNPGDLRNVGGSKQVLVASLKAKSITQVKVSIKVPAYWPVGTSYVHAFVDSYANLVRNETNEQDNYSYVYGHSTPVTIVHKRSNLKTSGKLVASKTKNLLEGEPFSIDIPIENNGDDETRSTVTGNPRTFYVNLYISRSPGSLVGATSLIQVITASLPAGGKRTVRVSGKIPKSWPVGASYLHAVVDSYANYIKNESDEQDNYSYTYGHSIFIDVGRVRSNLKTRGPITSNQTKPTEGQKITLQIPVENNGTDETRRSIGATASTSRFYVTAYLAPRPGSMNGTTSLGGVWVNSLKAGGKATATINVTIPINTRPGQYWIHALIDSYGNYIRNEQNDSDNYSYTYGHSLKVEVTRARSNLKTHAKIVLSNTKPNPGELISYTATITNNGTSDTKSAVNGSTRTFYVDYYISRYPSSLTGARHLGRTLTNSMAPAQTRKVTLFAAIPSNWPKGRSYIHVIVDGYTNRIRNENDETDNYSYIYGHSVPINIGNDSTPLTNQWSDLTTQSSIVTSRAHLSEGQQFTVQVPIQNIGIAETWNKVAGQSTNFNVTFYISRLRDTLDGGTVLGTVSMPSMMPKDINNAVLQTTIPTGWQEGTSYIHVLLDGNSHVQNEQDLSNNVSYKNKHSLAVTVSYAFSNLRLSGKMLPCQSKVEVGEQICVDVPIGNYGPAGTTANFAGVPTSHTTLLYLSQFPNSLENAVKLTTVIHSPLGAGGRITPRIYATIPSTWYTGTAYLHAVVDGTNSIQNESNEGDNSSYLLGFSTKIDISKPHSNLKTGGAIKLTRQSFEVGQQIRLSLNLENNGIAPALNSFAGTPVRYTVSFYLSTRPNTLAGATAIGSITTDSLSAGGNTTVTHSFVLPATWSPGTSYIHARVDSSNTIKNESNEGDNTSIRYGHSTSITVTRGTSNLVTASQITLSTTTIKQAGYVRVTAAVKNTGNTETFNTFGGIPSPSTVYFYISKRPDSILGGTQLGTGSIMSLGPGGIESVSITVQIPATYQVGSAYIHAHVDGADNVKNELNEGDNYSYQKSHSRAVTIQAKTTPGTTNGLSNLKLRGKITVSKTVVGDGETYYIYAPIHNAGQVITASKVNGSPISFYVHAYLSRNPKDITGASRLGGWLYNALAGGANLDAAWSVKIPKNWPQGQSYIHVFVDSYANRVRNESSEADNWSYQTGHSTTIRVEHRRSNLRTNGILSLDRKKVRDGDYVKVTIPIINNGSDWTRNSSGALSQHHVYLYLSRLPGTLAGATLLKGVWVPPLNSQEKTTAEMSVQVPKSWAPGTSYIHAFVDGYGNYVKNETNEEDNYSFVYGHSATITVESRRSNLRTASVVKTSQSSVKDGDYINIQVPVLNNGNETTLNAVGGSATRHHVYVYLSKTPGSLAGATLLAGAWLDPLRAGERATATIRARIPSGWATGTSYIHAFVDGYGNYVKNETNENDNYSYVYGHSAKIQVIRRRSNLRTFGAVTLSHATRNDGEYLTVTVPVINNGDDSTRSSVNGALATYYVRVYLAPRSGDLSRAVYLGQQLLKPLHSGETTSAQLNVRIPINTNPARWYVHAWIDGYYNRIKNESNENDNYSYAYNHSAVLNVTQTRSNLKTYGNLTSNANTYSKGAAILATIPIQNAGTAETLTAVGGTPRSFYVGLYISRHPSSLSGASLIKRVLIDSMKAGAKKSIQISGNIPTSSAWTQGGPIYLHAFLDSYANYVKNESDETDNYSYAYGHSVQVTLQGTPGTTPKWSNLAGTGLVRSDKQTPYEGDTITLSFPIQNNGKELTLNKLNGVAANFKVRFYIAPNATNLIGAVNLGETSIYAMQPGASETAVWHARIPAAWPSGKAYLHAQIDPANAVGNEDNRLDNISFYTNLSTTIIIGSRASNLRTNIPLLAKPSKAALGDRVNVNLSVLNNGDDITRDTYNGRARPFTVDLYISQSPNALTSAVKVKTVNFAALGANATSSAIVEITIPTNWATQTAYIHAVIDPNNAITNESNEGDNGSWQYGHSAVLQLSIQRSNLLTYKTISLSTSTVSHNVNVTAIVYIENNGAYTTLDSIGGRPARHRVDLYIGRYANGLSDSTKLGSATVDALVASGKATATIQFSVPATWPTGQAYIHAVLDAGSAIGNESNKGDNYSYQHSHSTTFVVSQSFSNLATSAKVTSSNTSPKAGSFIYVTAKVTNKGQEETLNALRGSSTTSLVYLWLSPVIGNNGGSKLGSFTIPSLKPKESHTVSFWVQIPTKWPPGSAYLHVQVDATNTVKNESNEGDNWSYSNNHSLPIQVDKVGAPPSTSGTSNLRTGKAITLNQANPFDGQKVTATIDIYNNGQAVTADKVNGTARLFYVDIYISKQTGTLTGASRVGRVQIQPLAGGAHVILPFQFTIPVNWKGTAYIHTFVDSYANYIKNESDENDNFSYRTGHSLTITIRQKRSNLRIYSKIVASKTSLIAGQYFDVSVTVENNGTDTTRSAVNGPPQTHYLYLYLGTQAQTTSGAATLIGAYLPVLKAKEKFTQTFHVRVPTTWKAGTAYLHAFADGYGNRIRNESDETDNYSYRTNHSTQVTVGQSKSNVRTGGEITLDKKSATDGSYVNMTVPVWNNGADLTRTGIAGSPRSFYVRVYLSRTNNTLTGAKYLGQVLVNALPAGGRSLVSLRGLIPANFPTGKAYIHAWTDGYYNYVKNESNEADNYSYVYQHSTTLTITHSRSNLKTYAGLFVSNSAPTSGQYIDVNIPIENKGIRETLNAIEGTPITHYVRVYLGKNPSSLSGAVNLGGMYVQSLQPGQKTIAQLLVKIPKNYAGQYYVHAFVDATNRVRNESDDTDNYSYVSAHSAVIFVNQKRSNIRTSQRITLSASQVRAGQKINVTVPIINAGSDVTRSSLAGAQVGFTVTIYMGPNAVSFYRAIKVGTFSVGVLTALGQTSKTVSVTVPSSFNGNYWVHAFVDSANNVRNESDEKDNRSYQLGHSAPLGVNQLRSNLLTNGSLSVNNKSPQEGGLLTITVPVRNNDIDTTRSAVGGNAVGFDTWIYISSSPSSLAGGALVSRVNA